MIHSMTGFGSGRAVAGPEELSVELRSVNGKFCEVKARLPRELAPLEAVAVRRIKERIARGGVELGVRRGAGVGADLAPMVNERLAEAYVTSLRALRDRLGLSGDVSISDLIGAEGVLGLGERAPDLAAAERALVAALDQALDALVAMRAREGEALARDLEERLRSIDVHVEALAREAPESVALYRERLRARVAELIAGEPSDPGRLEYEVALFADRSDVSEELTRLRSHVSHFRSLMGAPEPSGRRLDFLVQEMNREVNTTGSKSQRVEIASRVVELKAELERIREQVQNVE